MDENDHGIFLARLAFRWCHKPPFDVEAFVCPPKAFSFAPCCRQCGVIIRQLAPFTDWSDPDLGRRFKRATFCGCEFTVLLNAKVWEISESVKSFCAFPNCAHRIVGHCQFRDRTSTADYLSEKN